MNEQKNNGAKVIAQNEVPESGNVGWSSEEKAQYEVFRNGKLPRETISGWIDNDLRAIMSFVSGVLNDPELHDALVEAYYKKYQKLHANKEEDVEKTVS